MTIKLTDKDGELRFEVHAKPRAKKSRVLGLRADALEVALAAPPVDGAANDELVRVLAEVLEVPRRNVTVLRGETSQKKLIGVTGLDEKTLRARLLPA